MKTTQRFVLAAALAASAGGLGAAPCLAQDVDKNCSERCDVKVWQTIFGFRIGDPTYDVEGVPAGTRIRVPQAWWATDTSTQQRFLGPTFTNVTTTSAAVVTGSPGTYKMENMQDALQSGPFAPHTRIPLPDMGSLPAVGDIYIIVDLDDYVAGGGVAPPLNSPIQVVNGAVVSHNMPGLRVATQPFTFDAQNGWTSPAPYTGGGILIVGEIGITPGLYSNGPLTTGVVTHNATQPPPDTAWSEVQHNTGQSNIANTVAGYRANQATDRVADQFTVPAGETWAISSILFPVYQTGSSTTSTLTGVTLRILNGPPGAGGAVIWGDTTTNRLLSTGFSGLYRTFNTVVAPICGGALTPAGLTRPIMDVRADVNTVLGPGTYYLDWAISGTLASGPWAPPTTRLGTRQAASSADARQSVNNGSTYAAITDTGQGCTPAAVAQDLAFVILGSLGGGGCYANCDGSTSAPILNVADFACFLNMFAAGASYANCDNSTAVPVLTIADFGCFLNRFAAGCS